MNSILILLSWLTLMLPPVRQTVVSDPNRMAATPRLTTDATGRPLLSWVEKTNDTQATFYFAISGDGGLTFGPKVRVNMLPNMSVHAEGMPKVTQKDDGTLLAVFEVSRPTTDAARASDLLFVTSRDTGKTWTQPKPVHRDTTPGKGHSFSDITRLPNGEIGIVWLDEKMRGYEGRSVKFVQTLPGGGFSPEVVVDSNACQCCRTNVFVDSQNHIHLTYRDLLAPVQPGAIGARDISTVVSTDGGSTFSSPQLVLADNWMVNACPHTGPSLAQVGDELFVSWYSAAEVGSGLRLTRLGASKPVAVVLNNRAKHPQLATMNNQLYWVWDESMPKPGQPTNGGMLQYATRIALRPTPNGPTTYLTPADQTATHPVLLSTQNGLLLAYEQRLDATHTVIMTQLVTGL